MKKRGKLVKIISAFVALTITAGCISSALAVFAQTPSAVSGGTGYSVTDASPALPVFVNTKTDLSSVTVQMSAGAAPISGDKLIWALDSTNTNENGIMISNSSNYIAALGTGIFTFNVTDADSNSRKVYVIANEVGDYNFNLEKIDFTNSTYDSAKWVLGSSGGANGYEPNGVTKYTKRMTADNNGVTLPKNWTGSSTTHFVYNSEILKDFGDYTITAGVKIPAVEGEDGTKPLFGITARAAVNDDAFGADATADTEIYKQNETALFMRMRCYGGLNIYGYNPSATSEQLTDGNMNKVYSYYTKSDAINSFEDLTYKTQNAALVFNNKYVKYADGSTNSDKLRKIELALKGDNILYKLDNTVIFDSSSADSAVGSMTDYYDRTYTAEKEYDSQAFITDSVIADYESVYPSVNADANELYNKYKDAYAESKGTIGFTIGRSTVILNSVTVSLGTVNADSDMPAYSEFKIYSVDAANPFLPMTAGYSVSLGNFSVVKNGETVLGDTIKWTLTEGDDTGIKVLSDRIEAYKKGVYKLTGDGTELYVAVRAESDTAYTVYSGDYREQYNTDGTARTDYGSWKTYILSNGKVFPLFDDYTSNTNYTSDAVGGFMPYTSEQLRNKINSTDGINDRFYAVTVLDDELVSKLTNYTVNATVLNKYSGRSSFGLAGRLNIDTVNFSTAASGVSGVNIGAYGSWETGNQGVKIIKGFNARNDVTGNVNAAWYNMNSQSKYSLHNYTLNVNSDTLTYGAENIKDETITVDGIASTAGNAGFVLWDKKDTSNSSAYVNAETALYDFSVTVEIDDSATAALSAKAIAGYKASDYTEQDVGIKEITDAQYSVSGTWTEKTWQTVERDGMKINAVSTNVNNAGILRVPSQIDGKTVTHIGPLFTNGSTDVYGNNKEAGNFLGDARLKVAQLDFSQINTPVTFYAASGYGTKNLEKLTLPNAAVTFTVGRVFQNSEKLRTVENSASIRNIGQEAFMGCSSLGSFEFSNLNGITSVSTGTFSDDNSLTSVKLADSITEIQTNAFYGCTALYDITLPKKLTLINNSAFFNAVSLKSVEIPESVQTVGASAFKNAALLKGDIILSENCTTLGKEAFSGTKIENIYFYNAQCEIGENAIPSAATVHGVKGSTAETYAAANNLSFEEIDTESRVITVSKNSKSYLPVNFFGKEVEWDATVNDIFEVIHDTQTVENGTKDYAVIAAFKQGEQTICGTLSGIENKISVTVKVTDYDESAYSHFLVNADAVLSPLSNGEYKLTLPDYVKYDTVKINGAYGNLQPVYVDGVKSGREYTFKNSDYGCTNGLKDIQIRFETVKDTSSYTSQLYSMGATVKDYGNNTYGLRFTGRALPVVYDMAQDGTVYGKFRTTVKVESADVEPILLGAMLIPQALITENGTADTEKMKLSLSQAQDLADGKDVAVKVKTGNKTYTAQNLIISSMSNITAEYGDYNVILADIPENMRDTDICMRSYLVYRQDGAVKVKYSDVITRNYDDVKTNLEAGIGPFSNDNVGLAAAPTSFLNTNAVICWGDSITQSTVGKSYPSQLMADLGGQYKVYNAGVAGETSFAIMSRANLINVDGEYCAGVLREDVTFAAGQTQSADIATGDIKTDMPRGRTVFLTGDGKDIRFVGLGNGLPTTKIIIDGKSYKFSYATPEGAVWGKYEYYITRDDAAEPLTLKAGTKVYFDYDGIDTSADVGVVLFGANDGVNIDPDVIIEKYKQFELKAKKGCMYIIPYFFTTDSAGVYETKLGRNAINVAEYFSQHAFDDYGVFPDYRDLKSIENHKFPQKFMAGDDASYNVQDCHMNAMGYKILADLVYARGAELGYWN